MSGKKNPFSIPPVLIPISYLRPKVDYSVLYDFMQQGNSINFVQAKALGINNLESQIAELRKITNIYSRIVRINAVKYSEYSLQEF